MGLYSEIFEQPQRLRNLLNQQMGHVKEIASAIRKAEVDFVFLAARGSSDHAALYAKYLWGSRNGLPIALAAPSLFSKYGQPPCLENSIVVGISQSGQSPDIVSVLVEGNRQGAITLAITNDPESPLANAADYILDISAGKETAVAATKTYTSQLMAISMLSSALINDKEMLSKLNQVPDYLEKVLVLDQRIKQISERYRYMSQCVVLGRGFNYSTAHEWALKLKELTYVVADSYSPADFRHGPIAIVERGFPVFAVAPQGPVFQDILDLLRRLKDDYSAELVVLSNNDLALDLAHVPLPLPKEMPEWVSPMVNIVPAQLFCYHLTVAKGFDTESPRGLQKITETD